MVQKIVRPGRGGLTDSRQHPVKGGGVKICDFTGCPLQMSPYIHSFFLIRTSKF